MPEVSEEFLREVTRTLDDAGMQLERMKVRADRLSSDIGAQIRRIESLIEYVHARGVSEAEVLESVTPQGFPDRPE